MGAGAGGPRAKHGGGAHARFVPMFTRRPSIHVWGLGTVVIDNAAARASAAGTDYGVARPGREGRAGGRGRMGMGMGDGGCLFRRRPRVSEPAGEARLFFCRSRPGQHGRDVREVCTYLVVRCWLHRRG